MSKATAKPTVRLIGTDGNVFAIAGKVGRTLRAAGQSAQRLVMEYVEVK